MSGPDRRRSLSLAENRIRRGLYVQPFTGASGERIVVAVDRLGRRLAEATIFCQEDRDLVVEMLWEALDRADPPRLRLLR